ncbi:hypothetical protein NQZ68_008441 [Dissostichus eleginoides]|nr:hypothetical protein NQZ68_008441 [Dissostichus eleginoides]
MVKDNLFRKKRNAAKEAWENLKGQGLEQGLIRGKKPLQHGPSSDEAIGARPSISPPVLVASALANPTILFDPEAAYCSSSHPPTPPPNVADDPGPSPPSSPSEAGTTQQPPSKKEKKC